MKRKILFSLVLCLLTLLVTGCKSSDDKKAQSLYTKGEYTLAKAMFEELADYEDSQDMVTECSYQLACKQLENCSYTEAMELLDTLGDYKDCRTKRKICNYYLAEEALEQGAFDMAEAYLTQAGDYEDAKQILNRLPSLRLMHYLQTHGDLSATTNISDDSAYVVTLRKLTEEAVEITYKFDTSNSTVVTDTKVTMVLTLGQPELLVKGVHSMKISFFGKTSTTDEAAEGKLDIRTYQYGDKMFWDKTTYRGYDVNGNAMDSKNAFFETTSNAPLERAFKSVEAMLLDHNVGITIQQLGFASL